MLFRRMGLNARSQLSSYAPIDSVRSFSSGRSQCSEYRGIYVSAILDSESSKVIDSIREKCWAGSGRPRRTTHVPNENASFNLFQKLPTEKLPQILEAAKAFSNAAAPLKIGNVQWQRIHVPIRSAYHVVLALSPKDTQTLQDAFANVTTESIKGEHVIYKGYGDKDDTEAVLDKLRTEYPNGVAAKTLISLSVLGLRPKDLSVSNRERKSQPGHDDLGTFVFGR